MTFEQVQAALATKVQQIAALAQVGIQIIPDDPPEYEVVWAGGELLPDRPQSEDDRLRFVPSYDLDDGEAIKTIAKRKFTFTGNHTREKREARRTEQSQ